MNFHNHRLKSDGFCKDCGIREKDIPPTDPFCDGCDDPDDWIDRSNQAHSSNVAGYLAGIQYMASIGKLR